MRSCAAQILRTYGTAKAAPALVRAYRRERSIVLVRERLVEALAATPDASVIPCLEEALNDPRIGTRAKAAAARRIEEDSLGEP